MDVLIEDLPNSDEEERANSARKHKPYLNFPWFKQKEERHGPTMLRNSPGLVEYGESLFARKEFKEVDLNTDTDSRTTFLATFSPDGLTLATSHGDHDIRIFDVRTMKQVKHLTGHPRTPWTISFHPVSNTLLASGCLSGQVRVWDIVNGGSEKFAVRSGNASVITSVCFHPTDMVVAFATGNSIYLWDWSENQVIGKMQTNVEREQIRHIRFDPTGTRLLTAIANAMGTHGHARVRVAQEMDDNRTAHARYEDLLSRYEALRQQYQDLFLAVSMDNAERARLGEPSAVLPPRNPPDPDETPFGRILSRAAACSRQTSIRDYAVTQPPRRYRSESPTSSDDEGRSLASNVTRPPRRPSYTFWTRSHASRARSRGRHDRFDPYPPAEEPAPSTELPPSRRGLPRGRYERWNPERLARGNQEDPGRLPASFTASLDSDLENMRRLSVYRRQVPHRHQSYRSLIDRLQQVRQMLFQLRYELRTVPDSSESSVADSRRPFSGERAMFHRRRLQEATLRARTSATSLSMAINDVSDEIDSFLSVESADRNQRLSPALRRRGITRWSYRRRGRAPSPTDEELLSLPPPPPPPGSPPPQPPAPNQSESDSPVDGPIIRVSEATSPTEQPALVRTPPLDLPSTSGGTTERRATKRSAGEAVSSDSQSLAEPSSLIDNSSSTAPSASGFGLNPNEDPGMDQNVSSLQELLFSVAQCLLDFVARVLRVYSLQNNDESSDSRQGLVDMIHSLRSLIQHFLSSEGLTSQQEGNPLRRVIPRLDELAMEASRAIRGPETPAPIGLTGLADPAASEDALSTPPSANAAAPGSGTTEATAALRRHLDTLVEQMVARRTVAAQVDGTPPSRTGREIFDQAVRTGVASPSLDLGDILPSSTPETSTYRSSLLDVLPPAQRPRLSDAPRRMWDLEIDRQTLRNERLRAQSGPDLAPVVEDVLNSLGRADAEELAADVREVRTPWYVGRTSVPIRRPSSEEVESEIRRHERDYEELRAQAERIESAHRAFRQAQEQPFTEGPARWLSNLRDRIRTHAASEAQSTEESARLQRRTLVAETQSIISEHMRQRRLDHAAQTEPRLTTDSGGTSAAGTGPPSLAGSLNNRQSLSEPRPVLEALLRNDGMSSDILMEHIRLRRAERARGATESSNDADPISATEAVMRSQSSEAAENPRLLSDPANRDIIADSSLSRERAASINDSDMQRDSFLSRTTDERARERQATVQNLRQAVANRTRGTPVELRGNGTEERENPVAQSGGSQIRQVQSLRESLRDWRSEAQRLRLESQDNNGIPRRRVLPAGMRPAGQDSTRADSPPSDPRLSGPRPLVRQNAIVAPVRGVIEVPLSGQEFLCQYSMPTCRIQYWDFSLDLPNLTNAQENVVVPSCKVHGDAWIDVSSKWDVLAAVGSKPSGSVGIGIYSLDRKTLGQLLFTTSVNNSVCCLSLSPSSRYLIAGFTGSRAMFGSHQNDRQTIAKIFRVEPSQTRGEPEEKPGTPLQLVREIERSSDSLIPWSLNSLKWSPHTSTGIVLCTNKGHVKVLS